MKIIVKAKPGSKQTKIEKIDDNNYTVWVKAQAKEGRANEEIIKALAEYFNIKPIYIEIISGHMARMKVVKIND